ncbi:MAG TPA: hypothetical protein QF353_02745 [Gammaproteobacteria bacterium]|nr:hypothetical protein [Gammaproteobacteria bacterium]
MQQNAKAMLGIQNRQLPTNPEIAICQLNNTAAARLSKHPKVILPNK